MVQDHPQWGPSLDKYIEDFVVDDRLDASFENYMEKKETTTEAPNDMIPLPLLETTLSVGENMHKVGFQSGGQWFPRLMSSLRGYTKTHSGNLFDHYYGFLCIRHLTRMVCIGVLTESEMLDDFLEDMDPCMDHQQVTELLTVLALDTMINALATTDLMEVAAVLGCITKHGSAFVIDGGLTHDDVGFLVDALWKSRKSLIPLQTCGLLPGLPALLFVLCEMTIFSGKPPHQCPWLRIQDLLCRAYLGELTNPERDTIRQLSRFVFSRIGEYNIPDDHLPADEEDARTVIEAYISLLSPPSLSLALAPIMLLDISSILFRFVYNLMTRQRPKRVLLEELAPEVIKAALQRVGLEIDREWNGDMQPARRAFTRNYTGDVFQHICFFAERMVSKENKLALGNVLLEMELHELAGRVLLFILKEREDEPESWAFFLDSLEELLDGLRHLPIITHAQTQYIAHMWRKSFTQLVYHRQGSLPTETPNHLLLQAMDAWVTLRPASITRQRQFFDCSNPRCAVSSAQTRLDVSRILCERCTKAWYCSSRCQQIHWNLATPDSHAKKCGRPRTQVS